MKESTLASFNKCYACNYTNNSITTRLFWMVCFSLINYSKPKTYHFLYVCSPSGHYYFFDFLFWWRHFHIFRSRHLAFCFYFFFIESIQAKFRVFYSMENKLLAITFFFVLPSNLSIPFKHCVPNNFFLCTLQY